MFDSRDIEGEFDESFRKDFVEILEKTEKVEKKIDEMDDDTLVSLKDIPQQFVTRGSVGITFCQLFNTFFQPPPPPPLPKMLNNRYFPKQIPPTLELKMNPYESADLTKVLFRPGRKKYIRYAELLPQTLCSKPYKYQVIVKYPIKHLIPDPEFYLLTEREGKCTKLINSVWVQSMPKRRVKRFVKDNEYCLKYSIQFRINSSSIDLLRLYVADRNSKKIIFKSGPIVIYARKQPEEDEFWGRFYDIKWANEEKEKKSERMKIKRERKRRAHKRKREDIYYLRSNKKRKF